MTMAPHGAIEDCRLLCGGRGHIKDLARVKYSPHRVQQDAIAGVYMGNLSMEQRRVHSCNTIRHTGLSQPNGIGCDADSGWLLAQQTAPDKAAAHTMMCVTYTQAVQCTGTRHNTCNVCTLSQDKLLAVHRAPDKAATHRTGTESQK